jgi:branched-chain amino acid transport system permease protein
MNRADIEAWFKDHPTRPISTPRNATILVVLALLAAVIFAWNNRHVMHILVLITSFAIVAVSLDFFSGYLGLVSIAHAAFMAIGAYISVFLTMSLGVSFWLAILVGAILTSLIALAIGMAAFKVRGHYFVLLTLALSEIVVVFTKLEFMIPYTNGTNGISSIPRPDPISLGNFTLSFDTPSGYLLVALVFFAFVLVFLNTVLDSRWGRRMLAVRENESLARTQGIDPYRTKQFAFAISCFFTGIAGGLYAHYISFIEPEMFGWAQGFDILVMTIIGGLGTLIGAIIGTVILQLIPEFFRQYATLLDMIFGLILVFIVLYAPGGIWSYLRPRNLLARFRGDSPDSDE